MKKIKLFSKLLILSLSLCLVLIGCSRNDKDLNITEVSDGNSNDEEKYEYLKIMSNKEYTIDGEIMKKRPEEIYFNTNGNVILENRVFTQIQNAIVSLNELELKDETLTAKVIENESKKADIIYDIRAFHMEPEGNGKVNIFRRVGEQKYSVDYSLIEENVFARISKNYLIWPNQSKTIASTYSDGIEWMNLDNNNRGKVNFEEKINIGSVDIYGNKIYFLYSYDLGVDYMENLMIINLENGEIELNTTIDPKSIIRVIDDNRLIFEKGSNNTEYTLSIYDLNSKIEKDLIKWDGGGYWNISLFGGGSTIEFPETHNKILYGDIKDGKISLKVAEIKGMELSEPIEIFNGSSESYMKAQFSKDGKQVIMINANNPEKIYLVEFNR